MVTEFPSTPTIPPLRQTASTAATLHQMQRATIVTTRTAAFQHVETLRRNRTKRTHHREFVVEGVRSITRALDHGWEFHQVWHDAERPLTNWAKAILARAEHAERIAATTELMEELSERDDPSELVAVVGMRDGSAQLDNISVDDRLLLLALDRPTNPGQRRLDDSISGCTRRECRRHHRARRRPA